VRDPVTYCFTGGFFERPRSVLDRTHLRTQKSHPLDVGVLASHVLFPHVHDRFKTEERADGCDCDSVLACSGLRNDPELAESSRENRLSERIVEFVSAGM